MPCEGQPRQICDGLFLKRGTDATPFTVRPSTVSHSVHVPRAR